MTPHPPTPKRKSTYKGYTLKEKWLPSLLLSLFAPLTVCFFGPFEIYGNNMSEFKFLLWDFWLMCGAVALVAAVVIFGLLLLLKGRVFDVCFGLLFGCSLMLFIQGNYLSLGVGALEGDGVGDLLTTGKIIVNSIIWIIVIAACVVAMLLLMKKFKDLIRLVSTVALIALVGMTVISFAVISMTTDVYAPEKPDTPIVFPNEEDVLSSDTDKTPADTQSTLSGEKDSSAPEQTVAPGESQSTPTDDSQETQGPDIGSSPDVPVIEEEVLTFKNLDTLATQNNIVIFIIDRFDHTYYDKAVEECPEIFDCLDGFTHFDDYVTLYPRTYPGVPHILTGVEVEFTETTRPNYMQQAYSQSPYWQALKDAGFDINVYTDDYYGYENATYMRNFVSNTSGNVDYKIVNRANLSLDMIRTSLYRYLPFFMRPVLGEINTPMYEKYVEYDLPENNSKYSTDMKEVYEEVTNAPFTFRDTERGVSMIHIAGCHTPNAYGADFGQVTPEEKKDTNVGLQQSFKIISAYIDEMKRMGVYEDATILILGDHCSIGSDTKPPYKPHVTTLLAKPAGVSEGGMKESKAQVAPEDIFATVLTAAGSDKAGNYGTNIFDIPENEDRVRRYFFQIVEGTFEEGNYLNVELEIVGDANNFDNWTVIETVDMQMNIYD